MTLARFVRKNVFRNKRRSILTALSIGFSLLLLTFMMSIWRTFYIDQGSAESAQRVIVRNKVSLVFSSTGLLPRKDTLPARRQERRAAAMVWRDLQRSQ